MRKTGDRNKQLGSIVAKGWGKPGDTRWRSGKINER
jgi:hypothetical protein